MFNLADLYTLTPRDLQVTPLQPLYHYETLSSASASFSLDYTAPNDRVLLMSYIGAMAEANPAQTTTFIVLRMFRPGSTSAIELARSSTLATGASGVKRIGVGTHDGTSEAVTGFNCNIVLLPETRIQVQANFSAGALANELRWAVHGVLIPRGNFAF